MRIALIDNCLVSKAIFQHLITIEAGLSCDLFKDPLEFIATKVSKYDLVISDFYFDKANLDFFWDYIDNSRLIILTDNVLDHEVDCMAVFKKNSIHSKRNLISMIRMTKPFLKLELLEGEALAFPQD